MGLIGFIDSILSLLIDLICPSFSVLRSQLVKSAHFNPDTRGLDTVHLIQPVCGSDVHHWPNVTSLRFLRTKTPDNPSVQHGLHCIFKCIAQLQLFFLFLSVLSFGLFYGSFYNEVVLCDDQKL